VTVHDIRSALLVRVERHRVVDKRVQVIPQIFLAKVLFRAAIDTHDTGLPGKVFYRLRVVVTDAQVHDSPGEQVDLSYVGPLGKRSGQLHHVQRLTARVGISPELEFMPSNEAVNADQRHVQPSAALHNSLRLRGSHR